MIIVVTMTMMTTALKGKTLSVFTDQEEKAVKKDRIVPFLLASRLEERGATIDKADNFEKSVSVDGGATYAASVLLDSGSVDKPYLVTDPVSNAVYVTWVDFLGGGDVVYFARSTDGGASFTPRIRVSDPGSGGTGPVPVVSPDGTVGLLWSDRASRILFDRSTDAGDTWGADVVVDGSVVVPPTPLEGGFRNPLLPCLAVDRTGGTYDGRLYAVWADARSGDPDVLVSHSTNGGSTWSAPVRANDDPAGNGADQFFPWAAVDGNGALHVTFLDRRDDSAGLLIGTFLATSTDGGASFGPNVRVSDGAFAPANFFYGDYTGAVATGTTLLPFWPDARAGEQDLFTEPLDIADFDGDGVPNDGDGSGGYADNPCTGGATASCDDNCPGEPDPTQADADGDGVGDLCDNCPGTANTDQADGDFDGFGDACDGCPGQPGADAGDPDGDGVSSCTDNCPDVPNAGQEDGDADGSGNPCDDCPDEPSGPVPVDTDGDGVGDECDCQELDPNDRPPREVRGLRAFKTAGGASFSWSATGPDDLYSLSRGMLSSLAAGSYGACLGEGLGVEGLEDPDLPPAGDGYFYLATAQNFECGLGTAGFGSDEIERVNGDAGACVGQSRSDVYATSEDTVFGTVTQGSLASTTASDDVVETIQEEVTGGSPANRYTRLEHRWTFEVPAGSVVELHVEFSQSASLDGDTFEYEYSTDGATFLRPRLIGSAFAEDFDRVWALPDDLSGTVEVRVVDTNRTPGSGSFADTVSIDEIFIRVVP